LEYSTAMRIIQLSDSHLSSDKPSRASELEACIAYINALQPQPDVVVHTGDISHDGLVEDYRVARRLLDILTAPYFVLAGNKDNRGHLIEVFADGRHIRDDMSFVQYVVEDFAARMIMVDTVSLSSNKGQLCKARLGHLRHMLTRNTSKPTVLFLHHPPFEVNVGPEPYNFIDWSEAEALMAELQQHEHLRGIFCGHVHRGFETSIGSVPASVVSSVASDVRWDKPKAAEHNLPIFDTHCIATELSNRA
jgi:3',5'-cyclic AMP phosphodiesterase CpdA